MMSTLGRRCWWTFFAGVMVMLVLASLAAGDPDVTLVCEPSGTYRDHVRVHGSQLCD